MNKEFRAVIKTTKLFEEALNELVTYSDNNDEVGAKMKGFMKGYRVASELRRIEKEMNNEDIPF